MRAFSPLEKSDLASSFFLQVSGVPGWRNGLSATCTSGLKDVSCRLIGPLQTGGGVLRAQAQLQGRSLSVIDALLAATAIQHKLTLVSRNVSDFSDVGLAMVNPWES